MKIKKSTLGLAAEYAVASELCRRNIYAQLTLGNLKRTDLLVYNEEDERMFRIEVKSKQGRDWPNCKGIYGEDVFLIFVDFAKTGELERPDFYLLSVKDWIDHVKSERAKHPEYRVKLDERNVPIWPNQITKQGRPYKGMGVKPNQIQQHKEQWSKITQAIVVS